MGKLSQVLIGALVFVLAFGLVATPAMAEPGANAKVKVLIGFSDTPGPAEQAIVHRAGGVIKYTYHLIPCIAASVPEAAIDGLRRNPRVTHVHLDGRVWAIDDELHNSWGVKRIGAGVVHSYNKGTGVQVAIIDTGIDYTHPDLDANVVGGESFVDYTTDYMDDDGHGTHVAGTVGAEDNDIGVVGVAPEAALYALKVLDETGGGYWSDIIAAIQWSVENGMQVINMSLGGTGTTDVEAVCQAAYDAGLVLVAAAGNSGNRPGKGDNVIEPASYESVIAVAATNKNDTRARWSSIGADLELAGPGVDVNSTLLGGGYGEKSGTSMASPHVAGTAALVWVAYPSWTNADVRSQLQSTADDLGAAGWDPQYGYGLVDADEACGQTSADDLGPVTSNVVADPNPTNGASSVTLTATLDDSTTGNSNIVAGEYFVGTVGDDGSGTPMSAADSAFDSPTEAVTATIDVSGWDVGQYTLYVHGKDKAGNWGATQSVVLDVTEAPSTIMYVESITFSSKVAGPNKFLYTTVKVVDGSGSPLEGVTVEMTLTHETGSWNFAGDTKNSTGEVKFTLLKAQSGYYTATVTNLILTAYTWDKTKGVTSARCELQDDGTVIQ